MDEAQFHNEISIQEQFDVIHERIDDLDTDMYMLNVVISKLMKELGWNNEKIEKVTSMSDKKQNDSDDDF